MTVDVSLTFDGPVAVVRLDDGKANAFRPATVEAISAALDEIEASDAGAVLFVGRPGMFSGGLDLKVLPRLSDDDRQAALVAYVELTLRVFGFGRPTVAALTGHAIAGGALFALACDVRLATTNPSRFGVNEVAIGLAMPRFGVEITRAAVAAPYLPDVLFHGRLLTYEEALARGIVESLQAPEALEAAALDRARSLATLPRGAYAQTKELVRRETIVMARRALDAEIGSFRAAFAGR
jgi:enoyl-CoA hydratase